jgi:hypothetical protein
VEIGPFGKIPTCSACELEHGFDPGFVRAAGRPGGLMLTQYTSLILIETLRNGLLMNIKRTTVCALTLLFYLCLFFQTANAKDDPWRPISPAELAQKAPVVEKDADAEYLLYEVRVDDSGDDDLALKYYVRVKIFTDRGREKFSKIDLTASPYSKLKDIGARVIKADGSIVELRKEEIFERTIAQAGKIKIKARSFAVPGIEPGIIIEYRYKEVFKDATAVMDLVFQKDIPVQNMTYAIRPYTGGSSMQSQRHNMPADVNFVEDTDKKYRRITMTNVPAFHEEPRMPPLKEVRPWMLINYQVLSAFSGEFYWSLVGTGQSRALDEALKPNDEVKRAAAEITSGAATDEEKVARIYEFCQTKIKNLSFDPTMTDEEKEKLKENKGTKDTLKRQMGWSIEIDLLFAALARAAGLEASIAFTGDRSEQFFNKNIRDSSLLHPASAAVKVGKVWKFFDPGNRFIPYGMLVWWEDGQDTLIPVPGGMTWSRVPVSEPEKSQEKRTGKFRLIEDGTLEGEVRLQYTGQFSFYRKRNNYDDSVNQQEETLKDEIKERLSTAELTDIRIENVSDPKNDFAYTFKIKVPNYAQKTGKRIFLQPGFFEHGTGAMFTTTERKFDVYFQHPWSEEDEITIELPSGYALEAAEQPAPVSATKGICAQTIKIGMADDKKTLKYRRSFFFGTNGNIIFGKANYPAIKTLFDSIRRADDHTLILRQQ